MKRVTTAQIALVSLAMAATAQSANADHDHWNRGVNARQDIQQNRIIQGVKSGQLTGREAAHLEHQQNSLSEQEARLRASGGGLSQSERERLEREQNALSRNIRHQQHDAQRVGGPGWSPNQAAVNGHPGDLTQPGFRTGYPSQPNYNGHPGYPSQPGYTGHPGYPGQLGYNGNPGYSGQSGYNGHHDHQGQPAFAGQPGFNGQPGFGQPGFNGNPGFNGQGINSHQENQQERIQQGLQSGQLTKHEYQRLEEKQARFAQLEAQLRASGGGLSSQERSQLEFEQRQLSQEIERQKHDAQVR